MNKTQPCPFSDQINPLQIEWKPLADFNNPPPEPVKSRNEYHYGGQYLREAILFQVADTGDEVRPHKIGLNFLGQ